MGEIAYCSECRQDVWLTDGACSNGHPRSCLRNLREASAPPAPRAPAPVPAPVTAPAPASPAVETPAFAAAGSAYPQAAELDTDVLPRRIVALLIDTILIEAVVLGFLIVLDPRNWLSVLSFSEGLPASGMATLLYFVNFEFRGGRTLGKILMGLQVVSMDGMDITWGQAVGRNLARIIDNILLIGLFVALGTKRTQRVGDVLAGTLVVRSD